MSDMYVTRQKKRLVITALIEEENKILDALYAAYNGEDRSEAAGHGVASERSETRRRELRAVVGAWFIMLTAF